MLRIIVFVLAFASPAIADTPPCAQRDQITSVLRERYGEFPVGMGLAQGGAVMEIWTNPDTGSWSLIVTRPDGVACLAATGQDYEVVPLPPNG